MRYTLKIHTAMGGDTIPLIVVAEGMARHAASAFGTKPLHGPTLVNSRENYIGLLLDAAAEGRLIVCDSNGRIYHPKDVVVSRDGPALNPNFLVTLFVRAKHLIDWGNTNGDDFHIEDLPVKEIFCDLENDKGEVIKKDYFRGFVGGAWNVSSLSTPHTATSESSEPPLPKLREQERKIMEWLSQNGYVAEKLPKRAIGKSTVKALARDALSREEVFANPSTFDKAWHRLRIGKEIGEVE